MGKVFYHWFHLRLSRLSQTNSFTLRRESIVGVKTRNFKLPWGFRFWNRESSNFPFYTEITCVYRAFYDRMSDRLYWMYSFSSSDTRTMSSFWYLVKYSLPVKKSAVTNLPFNYTANLSFMWLRRRIRTTTTTLFLKFLNVFSRLNEISCLLFRSVLTHKLSMPGSICKTCQNLSLLPWPHVTRQRVLQIRETLIFHLLHCISTSVPM